MNKALLSLSILLVFVVTVFVSYNAGTRHQMTPAPVSTVQQTPAPSPSPIVVGDHVGCKSVNNEPDPVCTPGAVNPDITQATIGDTICNPNWTTKSIRPPVSYTGPLKIKQISQYGYSDPSPALYEEDHLIALTDGGSPTDPNNLWPQPYAPTPGAHQKDALEIFVHKIICDGTVTLAQGQKMLTDRWTGEYQNYAANLSQGYVLGGLTDSATDPDDEQ